MVILAVFSAACSSSTSTTSSQATSAAAGGGTTLQQGANGALVFSPTEVTAKRGSSITVTNVGAAPHTFTVTGQAIDVENQPGQSQQVTIDLPPGTYPFICRFHVNQGMTGTLTVT